MGWVDLVGPNRTLWGTSALSVFSRNVLSFHFLNSTRYDGGCHFGVWLASGHAVLFLSL